MTTPLTKRIVFAIALLAAAAGAQAAGTGTRDPFTRGACSVHGARDPFVDGARAVQDARDSRNSSNRQDSASGKRRQPTPPRHG